MGRDTALVEVACDAAGGSSLHGLGEDESHDGGGFLAYCEDAAFGSVTVGCCSFRPPAGFPGFGFASGEAVTDQGSFELGCEGELEEEKGKTPASPFTLPALLGG